MAVGDPPNYSGNVGSTVPGSAPFVPGPAPYTPASPPNYPLSNYSPAPFVPTDTRYTEAGVSADPVFPPIVVVDEAKVQADAAQAKADALAAAKVEAKKAEPTDEEVVSVAKAMDFDSVLDWENRPERCENAKVEAKRMILGYRACLKLA